ncbi:MAG: hypothetical protein CR974_01250 [Gammaproteobacteria bacterium]|nr:MAG: hypothetical protein CR974_01250 [Gammaproteobacteria bacterium]
MNWKDTWQNLSRRERQLVSWGGLALAGILYYGLLLAPLLKDKQRLTNRLSAEKALYQHTQRQVQRIKDLGLTEKRQIAGDMTRFINTQAAKYHLTPSPLSQQRHGNQVIWQLSFSQANTADLMAWLVAMQEAGVSVLQFRLEKTDNPAGRVNASNIQLQTPSKN